MPRPFEFAISTKHPDYLAARKRIEDPSHVPDTTDVMLLLGVGRTLAQNYGREGKYSGRKEDDRYLFDRAAIRREMGLTE